MKIVDPKTKLLFSQAYILGGSPCSGKSTIAARISIEFDFQYYKIDNYEQEHSNRCNPNHHPTMFKYATMSWDQKWKRPISVQVQDEFKYYRERFEMMTQDLATYDWESPIILEGAAYLPELLELNNVNPNRVVFLIPTKSFQFLYYSQRPWIKDILKECKDPELVFENWMMRDHQFGQEIFHQAKVRKYKTIIVDGKRNINQQFEEINKFFGLI